jgi:hypothetical protein
LEAVFVRQLRADVCGLKLLVVGLRARQRIVPGCGTGFCTSWSCPAAFDQKIAAKPRISKRGGMKDSECSDFDMNTL